jgi:DNA-binding LacI/PurR family transcriptional regulator
MAASAFWMLARPAASGPASEAVRPRHMELETTLVIRDSTAPPRQA